MTAKQKIVKVFALCLAGLLICAIFFGGYKIISVLGKEENKTNNENSGMYEFEPSSDTLTVIADINAADIDIIQGDKFRICTDNDEISFSQKGNTVYINEFKKTMPNNEDRFLTITVPDKKVLEKLAINAGAGNFTAESLSVGELYLDFGAGNVNIGTADIMSKTEIDYGAGNITVERGSLAGLELDLGAGNIDLSCSLKGSAEIDNGAGDINIELPEDLSEYRISVDKGITPARLNGDEMKDERTYGNGKNNIEIDAAVGNITIKTNHN